MALIRKALLAVLLSAVPVGPSSAAQKQVAISIIDTHLKYIHARAENGYEFVIEGRGCGTIKKDGPAWLVWNKELKAGRLTHSTYSSGTADCVVDALFMRLADLP